MTLLQTQNLSAFYGDFQALFDINVTVEEGETVAVIGANGAGKTTFLRAVAGAL
jgi:branched-chain amino acid transport system ATP-binding protein